MQKSGRIMALAGALAFQAGATFAVTATGPSELYVAPEETVLWSSVTSASPTLKAYFPTAATRARLTINPVLHEGDRIMEELTPASPTYVWHPFAGTVPSKDEMYSLELMYFDASGVELSSERALLAVVSGAFGPMRVLTDTTSDAWRKVWTESTSKAIALTYDCGWFGPNVRSCALDVVHGASAASEDVGGLSGWHVFDFRPRAVWTGGIYDLTLVAGGISLTGEIERLDRGFRLIVK